MGLVGSIAALAEVGAHPEGRVGRVVSGHDHIGTLSDPEGDYIGGVWLHRYEVVGHDGHVVAVNSKALYALSAAIDQS